MGKSLRIDQGMMYVAVKPHRGCRTHPDQAYLHRRTGEIVFVAETAAEAERYGVPRLETAACRAAIERRPSDWLAIPEYLGSWYDDELDDFIRAFLQEQGIEPEWY
jgi:hypothetical protein